MLKSFVLCMNSVLTQQHTPHFVLQNILRTILPSFALSCRRTFLKSNCKLNLQLHSQTCHESPLSQIYSQLCRIGLHNRLNSFLKQHFLVFSQRWHKCQGGFRYRKLGQKNHSYCSKSTFHEQCNTTLKLWQVIQKGFLF